MAVAVVSKPCLATLPVPCTATARVLYFITIGMSDAFQIADGSQAESLIDLMNHWKGQENEEACIYYALSNTLS